MNTYYIMNENYINKDMEIQTQKLRKSQENLKNVCKCGPQERFQALGPIYYRDAHGALLVSLPAAI